MMNKWFFLAIGATLFLLWAGLGLQGSIVIEQLSSGEKPFWNFLLYTTLTSSSSLLALPVLAALPYGSVALQERQTNAYRYAMLRTGRTAYCVGKVVASFISAMMVQLVSMAIVIIVGLLFLSYDTGYVETVDLVNCIMSRLVCAGLWGCVAGTIAIIAKVSTAAYIAPLAISYSLSMLGHRLLPKFAIIDPEKWIRGEHILLICILLLVLGLTYFFVLRQEVKNA